MLDEFDFSTPVKKETDPRMRPASETPSHPVLKDVMRFLFAWRFPFSLGALVAIIAAILLHSPAHAQSSTKPDGASTAAPTPPSATGTSDTTPTPTPTPTAGESAPKYAGKPSAPKISWSSVNVDSPCIAITFDDGPHATNTPKLLAMLKQRGIHATFFMVGENAKQYPQIVKKIVAEGHEVGNHSWSHPNLAKMSDDAVRSQIQRTQDAITDACGVKPTLMRPPYGELTARQRQWVNADFGYKIILWDVDPVDWKIRNSAHVESEILKQTHNGSIILVHDIHATSVDAMPETLDALIAKGYKFYTVSELLAMDKPKAASATPAPSSGTSSKPTTKKKAAN